MKIAIVFFITITLMIIPIRAFANVDFDARYSRMTPEEREQLWKNTHINLKNMTKAERRKWIFENREQVDAMRRQRNSEMRNPNSQGFSKAQRYRKMQNYKSTNAKDPSQPLEFISPEMVSRQQMLKSKFFYKNDAIPYYEEEF